HVGKVDLSIAQAASTNVATVGQPLSFSMTIGSRAPATGVTMKDVLPASLRYVSAKSSQGSCSAANGTVTCALGAIADGGSAQVTVTVTGVTAGAVTNTATVSANQPDIDPTNNSATASTFINGSTCGEVITSSTKLSADVGPCLGDGVIIGADGITLNLNGHSIIGSGTKVDDVAGIRLPFRNSVTIENGSVTGFAAGIFINSGGGHTITNMNIHDNLGPAAFLTADFGDGIFMQYSSANRILNNQIIHNGHFDGVGIYGLDSNFNLIQGNTISKTTDEGVRLYGVGVSLDSFNFFGEPRRGESIYGNNVIGNTIDDNSAAGISSVSNVNAQYLNNDIERNGLGDNQNFVFPDNGIGLQSNANATATTNILVQNNRVLNNGGDGIEADFTNGNRILNNTTNGSGTNTTLRGQSDLDDFNGNCTSNSWTGNTYGSGGVSPACLASTNTRVASSASAPAPAQAQAPAVARTFPHRKPVGPTFSGPVGKSVGPAAAPPAPAGTVTATPACGSLITASVTLTADIGPCPGAGLIVGADNITVHLGGHSITGSGSRDGKSAGITLKAHEGVTVTNGSVSGFSAGVAINMGVNDTVRSLKVHDNIGPAFDGAILSDGIAIFHSFGTQVLSNTLTHNGTHSGIGVYGVDSNATLIKGNTITAGVGGTNEPLAGVGVVVTALLEPDDARRGTPVDGNDVTNNTITGNQGSGIVSVTNINASILGNVVQGNGVSTLGAPRDGIQVTFDTIGGASPRTSDTVLGNTVTGSGDNGIAVYGGGNTLQGNSATGDNVNRDGSFDLFDSHPTCDNNAWKGNTSGTGGFSPSCTAS
ncbi:MAG TPA: right-handed parallel beta-helix repeat-containing protein, partial [Candidatus Dormibacteraeota bacterium]|nr:right-handed parallel beta-helix repeat-containing protein [Candidatus Dormibacteraeota bacterium]